MRQKGASGKSIATIASRQHGVISTQQLVSAGLSRSGIRRRVADGRLHRLHQGVYAVGHTAPSMQQWWMAAVIACGRGPSNASGRDGGSPGGEFADASMAVSAAGHTTTVLGRWAAAVSHRSAAELWGLLSVGSGPVDVSVAGDGGEKRRQGVRIHRSSALPPAAVTLRDGIPVTTPARTISDLRRLVASPKSGSVSEWELRRAVRQADILGLPLGENANHDRTRSDLERDFLRLCRQAGFPAPEVNVRVGRHVVDFLWWDRSLVVETDGYRYHSGRVAFEDDRSRDIQLRALGLQVIRLSDRQVTHERQQVLEVLTTVLS